MTDAVGDQKLNGCNMMCDSSLHEAGEGGGDTFVPYLAEVSRFDDCTFHNAATCPDCAGSMFRQGGCFFCPECGYESCGV